jgi:hypothetical protein
MRRPNLRSSTRTRDDTPTPAQSDCRRAVFHQARSLPGPKIRAPAHGRSGLRLPQHPRRFCNVGCDPPRLAKRARSGHGDRERLRAASVRYEIAPPHSITSSAVASRFGGTPMPSAFAVLRLISIRILARPELRRLAPCPPQPLVWPPVPATKPLILKVEHFTPSARWPAMAEKPQAIRIHKDTFFLACVCLKRSFEFQSFV